MKRKQITFKGVPFFLFLLLVCSIVFTVIFWKMKDKAAENNKKAEKIETNKEMKKTGETDTAITQLVVAVPYSGIEQKDILLMEEEINKIVRKKLQAEIKFAVSDQYKNMVKLMLSGDEQLDIMMASGTLFTENFMDDNLWALDDLLKKYGQGILEQVLPEQMDACKFRGSIYGIPNNRDYAAGTDAYMLRKDILEKYQIEPDSIKTIEDLENIFQMIKEKEPDLTVLLSGGGTMISNLYFGGLMMGTFQPGMHMNYGQEEELSSLFETKEYYEALKRVRRWYLKGYLDEDILGQTEDLFSRVRKGEVFAYTTKWKPGLESQDTNAAGYEMVCVQLGKTLLSFNSYSVMPYVITKNTKSKEKSMELLNLMFTDADMMNLMSYGVEGIHYKKTKEGYFTYADKKKGNPFINNAWKVPNQFITGVWEGNSLDLWEEMKQFNIEAVKACDNGFIFDIEPVITEYFTLRNIYSKYKVILENGLVTPEEGRNRMVEEMKKNGLEDVLSEQRRQYDAWKMEKKSEE